MKKEAIEYHQVLSPVISYINNEIERDIIPTIKRVLYINILEIRIPLKS